MKIQDALSCVIEVILSNNAALMSTEHWCRFVYLWGGTCPPNAQICPPNVRCAPPKISRAFLIPASYFAFASGYAIAQTLLYKNIICLFHFIDPLLMIKWISLFFNLAALTGFFV